MPIFGITASSNMSIKLTDFYQIATTTLGSSNFVEFTNIPTDYTHLQIRGIARGATANTGFHQTYIQFNGDTASNYSSHVLYGEGTNIGSLNYGSNYLSVMALPGTNNTASSFGIMILDILDYRNTNKFKTTRCLTGADVNGTGYLWYNSGNWRSTNAITSIKIYANDGSGYFSQYSSFQLYGVKA